MADTILVCVGGDFAVDGAGAVTCTGTISIAPAPEPTLMNQETFEAFIPWALLMLVTGFGFRLIRRAMYSRG